MLSEQEIERIIADSLIGLALDDQRVLVIIPDATRTMPLPLFFRLIVKHLRPRVKAVDFLVALGTHPALSEGALLNWWASRRKRRPRSTPMCSCSITRGKTRKR
jgi:lactate racemase